MKRLFLCLFFLGVGAFGFWMGRPSPPKVLANIDPEKEFSLAERKSFVFIVYAYNQAAWCERSLRSIFEQEYDYYRVIFVDDGSTDATYQKAKAFILENQQQQKVLLIRNEKKEGFVACLHRAVDQLLDKEIAIPFDAKNWLAYNGALTRINAVYQNPDVWMTFTDAVAYPSYETQSNGLYTFYASLFKELSLDDRVEKESAYLKNLSDRSEGRTRNLSEPLLFRNQTY